MIRIYQNYQCWRISIWSQVLWVPSWEWLEAKAAVQQCSGPCLGSADVKIFDDSGRPNSPFLSPGLELWIKGRILDDFFSTWGWCRPILGPPVILSAQCGTVLPQNQDRLGEGWPGKQVMVGAGTTEHLAPNESLINVNSTWSLAKMLPQNLPEHCSQNRMGFQVNIPRSKRTTFATGSWPQARGPPERDVGWAWRASCL